MNEPLVSVCIPAYNSERYILRTVRAALAQTYRKLEVIVVDDCSSDNTLQLLKEIDDTRLRVLKNETNLGMTGNWNRCVRECRGDYIKLLPADDVIYPECVQKSVRLLQRHPDIRLVVAGTDLIDNEDERIGAYAQWPVQGVFSGSRIAKASVMLNNFYGNPVCAMFRRRDFEKTGGFDEEIPYILDFDLWLGLSALGNVAVLREHLGAFRVRTDSNTGVLIGSQGKAYTAEHIRLLDKHIRLGNIRMNWLERRLSIGWRWLRNYLIAAYIRVKSR